MTPEQFFLKYSFPCAHVLVEMGSIDEAKLEELKKNVLNNEIMNRGELMMLFPSAFRRISEVASRMNKPVWNVDVMKRYFLEEHNDYIDKRDGNYSKFTDGFADFCKVYRGEVIHKDGDALTVRFGERVRTVFSDILPGVVVGDKVTFHQAFAVEKVD
ncbi:MAG: HypC/HybG/HupF family hydrogenase formation chaperone [Nanoarchaeota archaeon]|nr:HypC/HybG/HupF family hydrogenase formation chaperone [Nanoarchaeota archaeon]MBU1854952.1 HypC/HybG/HupF family hydrogenase formation chaperone [Nanoarchaeota archaeon]